MTTNELKEKLQAALPRATKVKVRQYPMTYKGSMRGYTTVMVYGDMDYYNVKDIVMATVPEPKKTFVDNYYEGAEGSVNGYGGITI